MKVDFGENYFIYNGDNKKVFIYNLEVHHHWKPRVTFDVIYGDCIYESTDIEWIYHSYECLNPNGIFFVQTDYHTVAKYKDMLDRIYGKENFINWLITIQEWGGTSKRFFPRKHDDILMYAKGKDYKFYPERIQIDKVTKGTKFDKKGTGLKTPCDVFYDLGNFSTMSKERVKDAGGKNIQWQKPIKLMERLLLPTSDEGDYILDPFMGTGTTGIWCVQNNRMFYGIESDDTIYKIAKERIEKEVHKVLGRTTSRREKADDTPG